MSWVRIDGLHVKYGHQSVLDGINLDIPSGKITSVLGPSGCGKTTLLRSIAGLLPVSEGTIEVAGSLVSSAKVSVPPERRGIGWVPQDASLFPHLSVGDNIGFGLPKGPSRSARVTDLAELVGLSELLERSPSQLSGGQAQRVSLARALAPRPSVVLLDEPFAALDPMLRVALRREVFDLLRVQGSTALLVTHDQEEALSLSDHITVMMGGRILQRGTPREVYERPATSWVARFVGSTVELSGRWGVNSVSCGLGELPAVLMDESVRQGDEVRVVLRPEWIELDPSGVEAEVTSVSYAGHDALLEVRLRGGSQARTRVVATHLPRVGDRVGLSVRRAALAYR